MSGIPTNGGLGDYQTNTDQHIVFNNVNLDPSKRYFVYIAPGYPSSQPLPTLLTGYDPLFISKTIPEYPPGNFICITQKKEPNPANGNGPSSYTTFPDSSKDSRFYEQILNSERIQKLFGEIADRQGSLLIKNFRNDPKFGRQFTNPRIHCFGLTPEQANLYNNKAYQMQLFDGVLPLPKYVLTSAENAKKHFDKIKSPYGVFVAGAYGDGGSTTFIAKTKEELEDILAKNTRLSSFENIVLAECLKLKASVSIDLLIANPKEVHPYGIFSQIFADNNPLEWMGNYYPADVTSQEADQIKEMARVVGKTLAERDVRGYVSLDFNVDEYGNIYFGEINARYAGSTAERFLMMELTRPANNPTIIDLEKMAIEKGTINGYRLWEEPKVFLTRRDIESKYNGTATKMPFSVADERHAFRNLTASIIGALKPGLQVNTGDTLGKVISVSSTPDKRDENLENIKRILGLGQYKI